MLKTGPKGATVLEPLPWNSRATVGTVDHFRLFCQRFLVTPRGVGARQPFRPRNWQLEAVRPFFEGTSKINLLCLPRGNGKSGLIAAVMLYRLFFGGEGEVGVVVAQTEASARRLMQTMQRMVSLNDDLAVRVKPYKDKIVYPLTDSQVVAVASEQTAVEGFDATTVVVDELGFTERPVFEAALLSLKRQGAKLLGIGTPSTPGWRDRSPFLDLVLSARGGDPMVSLIEYGAPDSASVSDWAAIRAANPALGDFLDPDALRAQLPPKTSESEFKRARMGIWVTQSGESFIPSESWSKQERAGVRIPEGSKVILAFDGSQRWDASALVMASVSEVPHLQLAGFWFGEHDPDYQVPYLEVEQRILELCHRYRVVEFVADPFLWERSLQELENNRVKVFKFPQSPQRMGAAAREFRGAVVEGLVTHAGDPPLSKHVLAAQMKESGKNIVLDKPAKNQHIDAAVASVMAFNRAVWLGRKRKKKGLRSYSL